jgi:pimeloyl-ACP methyl ester carboxylesterase
MSIPTLKGITARMISTSRLMTRVLFSGAEDATPVLFLHGNTSSATWWEETLVALPKNFRGIAPDQRGFGDADATQPVDATRGCGDWADDAIALLDTLRISRAHIVGNSLGGSVVWRMLMEYPERFLSATLVAPGSPYGFGGTRDVNGTPCYDDFAGSGGGLVNRELIKRIVAGDRSTDSPFSPRSALRALIVKPPFIAPREEALLSGMLAMHIGEYDAPGDFEPSPNWPHVAPGKWGPANALAPKYVGDISKLYALNPKPNILWVRGEDDKLVSNTAASDPGFLGMAGLIPHYPGKEIYPPQPMIDQTRAVLEKYAAAGGAFQKVVIQDAGHVPFIEKPEEFNAVFHAHISNA